MVELLQNTLGTGIGLSGSRSYKLCGLEKLLTHHSLFISKMGIIELDSKSCGANNKFKVFRLINCTVSSQ